MKPKHFWFILNEKENDQIVFWGSDGVRWVKVIGQFEKIKKFS